MSNDAATTRIPVRLETTLATGSWKVTLSTNIVVHTVIARLVREQDLPFRAQEDSGLAQPYRLMWKEGNRYLAEAETLGRAGVKANDTLVMTHQARAGSRGGW